MISLLKTDPKMPFTVNRCVALIHKQLDDKHFLLQEKCHFSHEIIETFDKLYQFDNSTRLISLFRELSQLCYIDGKDMHVFVLKFEHIYNQIVQYTLDKRFLAAIFLSTLPPLWKVFETTVQVNSKYRATDLNWDEIHQHIFSRFESISTEGVTTVGTSAFRSYISNSVTSVPVLPKTKFCVTCKKLGHNKDQCFQKHPHLLEAYKKKKNKEIEEKKKERGKEKEKEKKEEEKFHAAFAYFSYSRALFSLPSMDVSKSYLDSAVSRHMCSLR
jgi:hypothetical protein